MSNKLQELTEKLYNEGLSKGKEEGEQLLARARSEAEGIVAAARKQASRPDGTPPRRRESRPDASSRKPGPRKNPNAKK